MKWHHWTFLLVASLCDPRRSSANANVDATGVRDSTLLSMRAALAHYDVSPCATAAQLNLLGQFARDHEGDPEAQEALFLRAAVAADLSFIAQLKGNADLNMAVAQSFGGDPALMPKRIEAALQDVAHGMYAEPAAAAIKTLRDSSAAPVGAAPGPRSDALLIQRAINAAKSLHPRENLAALGVDPCAASANASTGGERCTPELASLAPSSRRSLWYLGKVAAAEKRIAQAAVQGDPLAEAVAPILRESRRDLAQTTIQFLPDLSSVALAWPATAPLTPPAALQHILFISATELSYAGVRSARVGATELSFDTPESVFPKREKLADVQRQPATIKPVAAWVSALQKLKAEAADWSVGVVLAPATPAHLLARVMVSLAQAGATNTQLLVHTQQAEIASVPTQVVFAGIGQPQKPAELSLRVRMSGYVIRMHETEQELPRVQDGATSRYDVAGLARTLARRRFESAALSFVPDVTAEALLDAIAQLPASERALQLSLRAQL